MKWWLQGAILALALPGTVSAASALTLPDPVLEANRQFVQAMQAVQEADRTYDAKVQLEKLRLADYLLTDIIERLPESPLAVHLITNQFIGDFGYGDFRSRLQSLACAGMDSAACLLHRIAASLQSLACAGMDSAACLLHRIAAMLDPIDTPVHATRGDRLMLAAAHHLLGTGAQPMAMIAPYVEIAQRRAPANTVDGRGVGLLVVRALALMGQVDSAIGLARRWNDCSMRLEGLSEVVDILVWREAIDRADVLATEAATYARAQMCTWELGRIALALSTVGREEEAQTLFLNTVEEVFSRFKQEPRVCCAPELAIAAGYLGDPSLALGLLRTVAEASPWAVPRVLGILAARGETGSALAFADQIPNINLRGESYASMAIGAVRAGDRTAADAISSRLDGLMVGAPNNPFLMLQRARLEAALHDDRRWVSIFGAALAEAEGTIDRRTRGNAFRTLLMTLVELETGRPYLR